MKNRSQLLFSKPKNNNKIRSKKQLPKALKRAKKLLL